MNLLYVTILAPRIFRWLLNFRKFVHPCTRLPQNSPNPLRSGLFPTFNPKTQLDAKQSMQFTERRHLITKKIVHIL